MAPDDPRHGTYAGYIAGCREQACRTAAADYQRRRYFDQAVLGLPPRHVDKTGTVRRVQALQRLGWSAEHLSERIGHSRAYLNVAINRPTRRGIHRATADAVRRLYDELSMTPGPSDITRRRAEKKGWPSPLSWDEDAIDDPQAEPQGIYAKPTNPTEWQAEHTARRLADLEHAIDNGHTLTRVCDDLDITREGVRKWCQTNGRSDIYATLARRDADYNENLVRYPVSGAA